MDFEVRLIPIAKQDLILAQEYYSKINIVLAKKLYNSLLFAENALKQNPFFEIKYHNVRTLPLKSFPYVIHFVVEEKIKVVYIIAIVFGKQKRNKFFERLKK